MEENKKNESNNKNKCGNNSRGKKYILLLLFIMFVILFTLSGAKIMAYIKDSKQNEKVQLEIAKDIVITENTLNENIVDDKYQINFVSLKEKNSDTVGFLKVNGTNIEQVVVKAKDNSYYLNHNFEKQKNIAGWLFADYRNKFDGSDKNIIIYGHNMRNESMFGTLKNILNTDWHENKENRNVIFITEEQESIYEVFSVYQIEAEDYYAKVSFKDDEFSEFIRTLKERSKYNFNVEVSENDNILTLSTCGNNSKYRTVLHAVIKHQ